MRSGTLNVPAIVGFGKACELLQTKPTKKTRAIRGLRDRLFERLSSAVDGDVLNGDRDQRLPGNLNVSFEGVQSDALMTAAREIARLERLGLHQRERRAELRAASDGRRRGARQRLRSASVSGASITRKKSISPPSASTTELGKLRACRRGLIRTAGA